MQLAKTSPGKKQHSTSASATLTISTPKPKLVPTNAGKLRLSQALAALQKISQLVPFLFAKLFLSRLANSMMWKGN